MVLLFEAPYLPTDLLYLLVSEALRLAQKRRVTWETSKSFGWSFDAAAAMTTPRTSSGWSTAVIRATQLPNAWPTMIACPSWAFSMVKATSLARSCSVIPSLNPHSPDDALSFGTDGAI